MTSTRVLPCGLSRQLADSSAGAIDQCRGKSTPEEGSRHSHRFNRKPPFSKRLDISAPLFYWTKAVVGGGVGRGWPNGTGTGATSGAGTGSRSRSCRTRSRPSRRPIRRRKSRRSVAPPLAVGALHRRRDLSGHARLAGPDRASVARTGAAQGPGASADVRDDGHPIARHGSLKEAPVDVDKLNPITPAAFVSIEDRRFYRHWGIDPRGIARALLANMRGGGVRRAAAPSPSSSPRPTSCPATAPSSARRRR